MHKQNPNLKNWRPMSAQKDKNTLIERNLY